MATRACPQCGSQYVASVRRCIDCDVVLVDEADPAGDASASGSAPLGAGDQIAYELEGWGNQLKVTLEGMLDRAGILRVWESGALVVPAVHEDEVDALVATVEGGEADALDDDAPKVAFDIEGVTPDELDELDARLIADHIAHAWDDEGALLVAQADEEAVAALIDDALHGTDEAEGDPLAAQEALTELYVAVDKLAKHLAEAKLVARYVAATDAIEGLPVPYGMTGDDWSSLVAAADDLAALVRPAPAPSDDKVHDDDADAPEVDVSDADGDAEDLDLADEDDADDPGAEVGDLPDDDLPDDDSEPDGSPVTDDRARDAALALRARLHDLV